MASNSTGETSPIRVALAPDRGDGLGLGQALEAANRSIMKRLNRSLRHLPGSLVVPGRTPPSISAWRAQFLNASGWIES